MAAAAACLLPLAEFHLPAVRFAAGRSLVVGSLAAAAITQAAPVCLLGLLSPAILAAGRGARRPGLWAGAVLAAGSGGGIGGALVAGLWLLPAFGIARSYLMAAGVLAVAALPVAWPRRRWLAAAALLAMAALAAVRWHYRTEPPVVQSLYGQLEVRTQDAGSVLLIDGLPQTGLPAQVRRGDGLRHGYLLELALWTHGWPRNVLVVGLGAGLAPRLIEAYGVDCRTVEIDPEVVRLARERFGFSGQVTVADGRRFLETCDERFDVIFLDVCTSDRLPWHLFTVEALRAARGRLAAGGILVVQFIGDDGPWSAALAATVREVFSQSIVLAPSLGLGAVGPRWLLAARDRSVRPPDGLFPPYEPRPWRTVPTVATGEILTDDHFPAEMAWAATAVRWRRLYGQSAP
jgi:SAM-dependent methyltransferase